MKVGMLCGMANTIPFDSSIDMWIGVDRGALTLLLHDIIPICAIGDFDSISNQQLIYIEDNVPQIIKLDRDKDLSDTEAAIDYCLNILSLTHSVTSIDIYGATGGRLDHFLANINNLSNLTAQRQHIILSLIDNQNKITVLSAGSYQIEQENYDYLSFIPRNEGVILTITNVKYPLTRQRLSLTSSLTISNEWCSGDAQVIIERGQVIMIKSRPQPK